MDRDAEKADRQDQTPPGDAPTAFERDHGLAAEPVVDQGSYGPVEDAEPGGQDGVYDQEADRDGRQPPPNS